MKRKILSALLCVAMTATMLAGCGNKSNESTDDKNQEELMMQQPMTRQMMQLMMPLAMMRQMTAQQAAIS